MSIEGIIEKIISDAQKEADEIINNAKIEAEKIEKELKEEAEDYYEKQKKLLDNKYKGEKERAILNKRLDNRKELLKERQKWLDEAFIRAYKSLLEQSFDEYSRLIKKLLGEVSVSKDEEVVFGKKGSDSELKNLVEAVNKELGADFKVSKERGSFEWGFILRKGKIETNVTIDSLFKYKRDELEQKAWELLNATE